MSPPFREKGRKTEEESLFKDLDVACKGKTAQSIHTVDDKCIVWKDVKTLIHEDDE